MSDWDPRGLCHSLVLRHAAFFVPVNTKYDLAEFLIVSQIDPGGLLFALDQVLNLSDAQPPHLEKAGLPT